jgi:hypothetical protein
VTQERPSAAFQVHTLWSVGVMGSPAPAAVPSAAPISVGETKEQASFFAARAGDDGAINSSAAKAAAPSLDIVAPKIALSRKMTEF